VVGHAYVSATNDAYDASRLLLPEFVRSLEVKGRPVALVPNRDTALVTGDDDLEGLKIITRIADEALDGPRPLSGLPLVFENDEWADWEPTPHRWETAEP